MDIQALTEFFKWRSIINGVPYVALLIIA